MCFDKIFSNRFKRFKNYVRRLDEPNKKTSKVFS